MVYAYNSRNINGKVIDKYRLESNNLGLVIEDEYGKRYSVEFESFYSKPDISNLYGFIKGPFYGKDKSIDNLVSKGNYIGVKVCYSDSPVRLAYKLNYVSEKQVHKKINPSPTFLSENNMRYDPEYSYH